MDAFDYHRPATIAELTGMLAGADIRPLAGGTDLIPQMREGRRKVAAIVDIKHIDACTSITPLPDGGLAIGAAVPATAVARDERMQRDYPGVAASALLIGSYQVQNRASLGGNICNAAPSADAVPPLIAHGARAEIAGKDGLREIPLEEIFAGPGRTHLAPGEVLTRILLPPVPARCASHYLRFTPRREMDIAIAGVGGFVALDEAGTITTARIALASVAPKPIRAPSAEAALIGARLDDAAIAAAGAAAASDATPISDTRGSAEYRRELVAVLTRRVLAHCRDLIEQAPGESA
ncbi:MAG: xanthine dehydrogenase family protein subunit M [Salinarimonas sp.]|nr:xanthine dehydrogenase family protein subunit M [Salinarimonas sp.]